ncbi:E3 ubiquitin-protein ligase dtx3l [Mayamaea pseudoterrestris]|nr:E3 ubiquitin-protein ligase dtx3l [Mayamaea pseudoterrestris]
MFQELHEFIFSVGGEVVHAVQETIAIGSAFVISTLRLVSTLKIEHKKMHQKDDQGAFLAQLLTMTTSTGNELALLTAATVTLQQNQSHDNPLSSNIATDPTTVTATPFQRGETTGVAILENKTAKGRLSPIKKDSDDEQPSQPTQPDPVDKGTYEINKAKALYFVQGILELHEKVQESTLHDSKDITPIAMTHLVERMLVKQSEYQRTNICSRIDLGFHWTKPENMKTILTDGLLTRKEREDRNIVVKNNRSKYGDGVYTTDMYNTVPSGTFGSAGLLVARLQGKTSDFVTPDATYASRGLAVLRSSDQVVPLVQFTLESEQSIMEYYKGIQSLINATLHAKVSKPATEDKVAVVSSVTAVKAPCLPTSLPTPAATNKVSPSENRVVQYVPVQSVLNTTGATVDKVIQYTAPKMLNQQARNHIVRVNKNDVSPTDVCCICLGELKQYVVGQIQGCGHHFHFTCILDAASHSSRCPLCNKNIAEPHGAMPTGMMTVITDRARGCDGCIPANESIRIEYVIHGDIQKKYHPNPGVSFRGTTRTAYLPYNSEGLELLKRLKYAFAHGLTFRVGTSLTTGKTNRVVWSSIHHKTSRSGGPHGYPDPGYFYNCNEELDALGVPRAADFNTLNLKKITFYGRQDPYALIDILALFPIDTSKIANDRSGSQRQPSHHASSRRGPWRLLGPLLSPRKSYSFFKSSMPCLILTGHPCCGKSTLAEAIKQRALLRSDVENVTILTDIASDNEKATRAELKSQFDRHASSAASSTLIIVDSMNAIKGYHYELYCISKAMRQKHCVLWVMNSIRNCQKYNESCQHYSDEQLVDLMQRYEPPDDRNRWDQPLFRVDVRADGERNESLEAELLGQSIYDMHSLKEALTTDVDQTASVQKSDSAPVEVLPKKKGSSFKRAAKVKPAVASTVTRSLVRPILNAEYLKSLEDTPEIVPSLETDIDDYSTQYSRSTNAKTKQKYEEDLTLPLDDRIDLILNIYLTNTKRLEQSMSTQQQGASDANVLHVIDATTQHVVSAIIAAQEERKKDDAGKEPGSIVLKLPNVSPQIVKPATASMSATELRQRRQQYLKWTRLYPPSEASPQTITKAFLEYIQDQTMAEEKH